MLSLCLPKPLAALSLLLRLCVSHLAELPPELEGPDALTAAQLRSPLFSKPRRLPQVLPAPGSESLCHPAQPSASRRAGLGWVRERDAAGSYHVDVTFT